MADEEAYLEPYPEILAANKLAAFIYFTCQGHIFLQAGEEFGRTKFGDDNSFRSEPEVNMLRWKQTEKFSELVEYYKGLISLRKKLPGLYDKSASASERISGKTVHREKTVSFLIDNRSGEGNDTWDTLYVIYNASDMDFEVSLPMEKKQSADESISQSENTELNAEASHPLKTGLNAEVSLPSEGWEILADDKEADCCHLVEGTVTVPAESGMILGKRTRKTLWSLSMENRILRRWSEEKKTVI